MYVKQLSVFMENVSRRLEEITKVLSDNKINIISLSIADTNEFGIARLIVSDPEKGRIILKEAGFSAKLCDVIAVALENKPGALGKILKCVGDSGTDIDYLYVLSTNADTASMIIKVGDTSCIEAFIKDGSIKTYNSDKVYKLQ